MKKIISKLLPKKLKRTLKDSYEYIDRYFVKEHKGLEKYGLEPTQVYPSGNNFYSVVDKATSFRFSNLKLEADTPVSSIGSCFAEEFAYYMKAREYNYIREEDDMLLASANWGRVYTIPNLLQILNYSFNENYPVLTESTSKGWIDPLRESEPLSLSLAKEEVDAKIKEHRKASRKAFTKCKVLIITLGQNEAWYNSALDAYWAKMPRKSILKGSENIFSVREFNYSENYDALKKCVKLLQKNNPELKIIFTISPVASFASFRDRDVVSNSFANKCLLRSVVDEIVKEQPKKIFYFPSFEMVLCNNPTNFRSDNRHVKYSIVDKIFTTFSNSIFK